ncbi:FAD-dependent oxidoreductase [Paracoccus tegillarcae]|uniref:FAD-binding dehydrogenase n=1 Tax=Paracoccus tegillarcae TaxID=1529068 RepID=A0A2K9EXB4_9RHOB|nr:FAD-dependent oxidoreductase [Paracoccus tegillarcae]AUH33944.1 FAD-binding dehydrogenase [Paracoccus tegillarcae]
MAEAYDLIVLGSGAAGLSAAVTAAHHGLSVALLEKAPVLGGTSAWSGGWIWAPGNEIARRAGMTEDRALPRLYLQGVLGDRFDAPRVDAFLAAAPQMVEFFDTQTALQFDGGLPIPDTYGDLRGAGTGGRSVIAKPYDGRQLGREIALLREPLPETTLRGMTIQAGPDLKAFMTATRSVRSFGYVAGRITRHMADLAIHRRAMQLRNGSALIARLIRSALDLRVDLRTFVTVTGLIRTDGRVTGVQTATRTLTARAGVVIATGGFPHDPVLREDLMPRNAEHISLAVPTATGDGARLIKAVGGAFSADVAAPAAYCPVSRAVWPGGREGGFPHIIERGKPGLIGVLADGRRFCNEGLGYHDYVRAMLSAVPVGQPARSWLICDHRFIRRYGLGIVRPAPMPLGGWVRSGYLKRGVSLTDLAAVTGIDAAGLARTVKTFNSHAAQGKDPRFGRGTTPYMRLQGDPEQRPNPCLAPIVNAPFYAVEVLPGSFGTLAGITTDPQARVLDAAGAPIPGLYAAGADALSVFGGHYPAGGINLGPALTFGFIAGRHAAKGAS